ncbi:MAG: TIGR01212 family radical SAM protein [Pseudomonadota bacterium]
MNNRYNSINEFLKARFGERVFKVSLEIGSSCPNRDGAISRQGCSYCHPEALRPSTYKDSDFSIISIQKQLEEGIDYIRRRHGSQKVIAYFQNGSNTYAPAQKLARAFTTAASHPCVKGLAISTRPDCIEQEHLTLLKDLSRETFIWVELGLQSAHEETLKKINRGHTVRDFSKACSQHVKRGIPVCAHVILGLPGETSEMMCETARFLNEIGVWGVKIHNLHVLKDTKMEEEYRKGKIEIPSLDVYAGRVVDFLEELSPEILIHRLNSHSPRHLTIAPKWSINKLATMNAVHDELERRDSWQGKRFCNP